MAIVFKGEIKMEKPSLLGQFISLTKAATTQLLAGNPKCTEEELADRVNTCLSCPLLDKENFKCGSCGCKLEYKSPWRTSKCPEGKWKNLEEKVENNDNTNG